MSFGRSPVARTYLMEDCSPLQLGTFTGASTKLEALLLACDGVRAGRQVRYVFIGTISDRGPDARKVIDLLMHKQLSEGSRLSAPRKHETDADCCCRRRALRSGFDDLVG